LTINTRRQFLHTAALIGGAAVSVPLEALLRGAEAEGRSFDVTGYGPLQPAIDGATGLALLHLPEGFRYVSFGWTGDPLDSGARTPGAHDGMAAFAGPNGTIRLIRNHELSAGKAFDESLAYDAEAGGGTTTITFAPADGKMVAACASLAGTVRNCAGGPTPWGTWLTCEESTLAPGDPAGPNAPAPAVRKAHGYVFEVPLDGRASATPLTAMGRFVHEAVAVDPQSGIVYQTEDQRRSGLYRFVPRKRGRLAEGGRLQMLAVKGRPRLDLRTGQTAGVTYPIDWVDIEEPERVHSNPDERNGAGVFTQGYEQGGALFGRLEGAWYAGRRIFVTSTDGGNAKMGQVWELDIRSQEIRLVFESPGQDVLNMPDNLTVSPRGGLVLCEDGTANPCVHGLTRDGKIVRFARNNVVLNGERNGVTGDFRKSEFAGATFSPDGEWLFLNIQSPGITLAVTGPWGRGML
jgi:uncharacterized protein